jgi:peptidoglycan-associated lipoprotein
MQTTLLKKIGLFACTALVLAACTKKDADSEGGQFGANGKFGASASTPGSNQDFIVNVGDRVQFEEDSSDLTGTARSTLDKQAQWLAKYTNYSFVVEGHADERGTREYNLALGSRRAQSVRDYLAAKGLGASRFRTISYGKERPIAACNEVSCWSQNRRAVTALQQ